MLIIKLTIYMHNQPRAGSLSIFLVYHLLKVLQGRAIKIILVEKISLLLKECDVDPLAWGKILVALSQVESEALSGATPSCFHLTQVLGNPPLCLVLCMLTEAPTVLSLHCLGKILTRWAQRPCL